MAGKQMTSDSFTANLAGMSKNQLYDIMSQMKILIEQNQQQARQILVDNPALTKALFQAQIMLGMVQPPQAMPSIQQTISQPSQQSIQPGQPPSVQAQPVPAQVGRQEQMSTVQTQMPSRKKQPNQPVPPIPSATVSPVNHQSQTMPSHSLQPMQPSRHMSTQGNTMSLPPSSQGHTMPPQPLHSAQQPLPYHQSQVPSQPQQSLHSSSGQHPPLQPPLPPQPRPPPMQPFQHQFHSQMGPHGGFQPPGPPQPHHSQQPFSAGNKHPGSISYTQGQPPLPNQPLPHSLYQAGGSHLGADLNNQGGSSMQVDRGSWMPGPPENSMGGAQLPGPPPLPGQMGLGSQPSRQSQLTPEMEQALQQVMSITPEQVSRLPPEQRQQVLQLQQMMR